MPAWCWCVSLGPLSQPLARRDSCGLFFMQGGQPSVFSQGARRDLLAEEEGAGPAAEDIFEREEEEEEWGQIRDAQQDATSAPAAASAAAATPRYWVCSNCTFAENDEAKSRHWCELCGARRWHPRAAAPSAGPVARASVSGGRKG